MWFGVAILRSWCLALVTNFVEFCAVSISSCLPTACVLSDVRHCQVVLLLVDIIEAYLAM